MTDFHPKTILVATIVLFLISSCERVDHEDGIVLAELGDRVLLLDEVKDNVSPEFFESDSLAAINRYRNDWLNRQLKVKEAGRLGLDQHDEVQKRIQEAKESILIDAFHEAVYLEVSSDPVTRSEAQEYYESNREKFVLAERHVRFRHLIAPTLSDARNARNALQRGQSWRDIAEQYAVNPQQAIRISRQYFPLSSAARQYEEINDFLQVIGVSEISPIRRIDDHYHFVQLMDSREAGDHPQMEWIIDQITEWLMLEQRRKKLRAMEQNLFLQAQANNELRIYDVRQPEQEVEIVTDSLP
ncbi:peptidyl-prolyl cis-trans isomerase [Natronogracilivirga saccharolytica]|uniref:Peptidyl-prolyl cis-trans isomerase n=1 Tax=Natronogracilivirga saccharolytica TaxID=2812953 RepID=A0A8J7SAX8_9BACT|nr:peptidylprolyl isomerase [Natronogracilivirga saccharolytica]MBP3193718.1 peptidyl-prolyl cis-trans isomerase [Natronogracilivirga saccharolytica]